METVKDETGAPLVCYGCAHSMGAGQDGSEYPGRPSGERPCMFCTRNPAQVADLADVQARFPRFVSPRYDNVPVQKIPDDQYIATSRLLRDIPRDVHVIT